MNAFVNAKKENDKIRLSKEVKELRLSAGLTQALLAKKLGVSASAVKQWESGRCYPSPLHMKLIRDMTNNTQANEANAAEVDFTAVKKLYDKYMEDKLGK
jgi:putative transcriptional regulator